MSGNLCKNIRTLRKLNGITQAEFAEMLGLYRSTYAYYEKHRIPVSKIKNLESVVEENFGYSVEYLRKHDLFPEKKEKIKPDLRTAIEIIEEQLEILKENIK